MVYHDISHHVELNKIGKVKATAHIMDRLFSFVIDYLVISPFVLFFLYLSFNEGFSYLRSNPMADEKNLFYTIVGVSGVVYFSLIQSLFIYVWHATPGQYFLKVKLEFGEGNSLLFIRAFFRQLFCNLAFVTFAFSGYLTAVKPAPYLALIFTVLGLSYLSYMTNRKRRTFYDQVTDIGVVTLKSEKSFFDFEIEFRYWQSLVATLSIFAGVLLVAVILANYDRVTQRKVSLVKLQSEGFFCEEMNQVPDSERLGTAIALNLVNQLSDGCLDRESDFVLWRQKTGEYSLAYYAKSLTTASDEKEKQYLQQACAGENLLEAGSLSAGCRIANAFLTKNFEQLYAQLGEPSVLNDILKYQVSLALNKEDEIEKNLFALEKHGTLKAVKKFQVIEMISGAAPPSQNSRSPASADEEPNARLLKLVEEL
jgi:hypothetical protein